jgi:hypothetical protein
VLFRSHKGIKTALQRFLIGSGIAADAGNSKKQDKKQGDNPFVKYFIHSNLL